jgi:hypothetical protein
MTEIKTRGGKRTGAGRPPGTANKIDREARLKAAATGETPLDYMLRVMRDQTVEHQRRDDMAKAAASYVHARLSATEVKSETTVRYVARVPEKAKSSTEWQKTYSPEQTLQ